MRDENYNMRVYIFPILWGWLAGLIFGVVAAEFHNPVWLLVIVPVCIVGVILAQFLFPPPKSPDGAAC